MAKIELTSAFKDSIVIAVVTVIVLVLSYFVNVFIFLVEIFQKNPGWITYIDEIIMGLVTLSIGSAVFAWRRWLELQKETAERIRLQEKLLEQANTEAQTEHIIANQLRTEVEQRKKK